MLQAFLVQREALDTTLDAEVLRVGPQNAWLLRGGVSARNKGAAVMKAASSYILLFKSQIMYSSYFAAVVVAPHFTLVVSLHGCLVLVVQEDADALVIVLDRLII